MKKILVLTSSARVKGNSDLLADEFIRGTQESGHKVEKIGLSRKNIKGCLGCNACQRNTGVCVQKDDAIEIIQKMLDADIIVFATPVYFYHVNAQMKLLWDRTYAQITTWKDKTVYFITAGAAGEASYFEHIIDGVKHYIDCFENIRLGGYVLGMGTMEKGDVKDTKAMNEAYQMGKKV